MELYWFEAGPSEVDLAIRFGGLKETQVSNKVAVSIALGKLLRRAISALLREESRQNM